MVKEIGDNTIIKGKDYHPVAARVIQSTHQSAEDGEKAVYIKQGNQGISVSKETLKAILDWCEGQQ